MGSNTYSRFAFAFSKEDYLCFSKEDYRYEEVDGEINRKTYCNEDNIGGI